MHIPHTHVKRYLALRTPETDQIVKRYGDGKWYIVRYLEICNEHGENPSTYQRYLSTPGGCKFGLLALCTTLKTGVIVENYRFILNSGRYDYTTYVYKQLLASVYADKEVNKLLNHFGIDDYSHYIPREILYFVDIVMSLGIDITPFLRIKFREYKARTIYSCAQTLKSDDSITFYAELGLNDEELENVIKQACRMRKRSTTAVGILDMSEISIKEM